MKFRNSGGGGHGDRDTETRTRLPVRMKYVTFVKAGCQAASTRVFHNAAIEFRSFLPTGENPDFPLQIVTLLLVAEGICGVILVAFWQIVVQPRLPSKGEITAE